MMISRNWLTAPCYCTKTTVNKRIVLVRWLILNPLGVCNVFLTIYDSNSQTELELWDSTFHSVSLHGSLEHLLSDSKKIKKSLTCLAKYIKNKKINPDKSNNIEDFKDIGEATWRFVTAIYKSEWDFLIANSYNNSFRQKVCILKLTLSRIVRKKIKILTN